ncbi:oxidase EvaA [Nocardiopsis mwathae]|uniref:Oxidase EvaA n=1 Tax=Nocardiopsis mwathae TaxID=1472723 RepID=A0A7W9YL88_9ACTN|nr:NDP-hexose 2,3-dehydratase family protein [Nocardiopsis mwathae]MBB6174219.1 oxidase EvaA [Nocardiopsis mwathae]
MTIQGLSVPGAEAADGAPAARMARSLLDPHDSTTPLPAFLRWLEECGRQNETEVRRVRLDELDQWSIDPATGNIGHASGRFFTIEGLRAHRPGGPVERWTQPIIRQPEIGILGILVKDFGGVPHCLMQAKVEPGNHNGVQLSPTVQATRSNYTRVHQGRAVPYIEYFRDTARHRVLADVLQSEQGAWFYRKRNRNIVVEVTEDVEVLDGFCWVSVGQLHTLLSTPDLVNMDSRTVMACMPMSAADPATGAPDPRADDGGLRAAVARSTAASDEERFQGTLHWITRTRAQHDMWADLIPLNRVEGWELADGVIRHTDGLFFEIMGAGITTGGREVRQWTQPLLHPRGTGLAVLFVRRIGGVLEVLVRAHVQPGLMDVLELGPTVQCTPANHAHLAPELRPRFLDEALAAPAEAVRFDTVLSEEGGRFHHARTRYQIVETPPDGSVDAGPEHRWVTLRELSRLLRHSNYVNVEARTLVACLYGLLVPDGR